MIEPKNPSPVKLLAAVLTPPTFETATVRKLLEERWGAIDFEGSAHPFDCTDYYVQEMGEELVRTFFSFEQLISPEEIVDAKHAAWLLERQFAVNGKRTVNIDPGYLDTNKLVLVSFKYVAQKIYLERGVWADPVCFYRKGSFHAYEWTFEDFRRKRYEKELLAIRQRYKEALRRKR